ncbi:hypothetical protein ACJX0J_029450 [Zea mays]
MLNMYGHLVISMLIQYLTYRRRDKEDNLLKKEPLAYLAQDTLDGHFLCLLYLYLSEEIATRIVHKNTKTIEVVDGFTEARDKPYMMVIDLSLCSDYCKLSDTIPIIFSLDGDEKSNLLIVGMDSHKSYQYIVRDKRRSLPYRDQFIYHWRSLPNRNQYIDLSMQHES